MKTIFRIFMVAVVTVVSFIAIKYILGALLGIISPNLFPWLWGLLSLPLPWGGNVGLADAVLGLSCFGGALTFTKNM